MTSHRRRTRRVAVEALAPVAATDAAIRVALLARLEDSREDVRRNAVRFLVPLADEDGTVFEALSEYFHRP